MPGCPELCCRSFPALRREWKHGSQPAGVQVRAHTTGRPGPPACRLLRPCHLKKSFPASGSILLVLSPWGGLTHAPLPSAHAGSVSQAPGPPPGVVSARRLSPGACSVSPAQQDAAVASTSALANTLASHPQGKEVMGEQNQPRVLGSNSGPGKQAAAGSGTPSLAMLIAAWANGPSLPTPQDCS